MNEINYPNFENAEYKIVGYKKSSLIGFALFGFVMLTVAMLIVFVGEKNRISQSFKNIMWVIFGVLLALFILMLVLGMLANKRMKDRICFAMFDDGMVFYSVSRKYKNKYCKAFYTEIKEYGFYPVKRSGAKKPYLLCDLYNYGHCEIVLENDEKFLVPIDNIKEAREKMKKYFPVKETLYAKIAGIDNIDELE